MNGCYRRVFGSTLGAFTIVSLFGCGSVEASGFQTFSAFLPLARYYIFLLRSHFLPLLLPHTLHLRD